MAAAIAATVGLMFFAVFYILPYMLDKDDALSESAVHVTDLIERVAAEDAAGADTWPAGYTHQAPVRPLTVDQAHKEMQWHRRCGLDSCDRKRAAFKTLYEAGEIVPDMRSEQYVR